MPPSLALRIPKRERRVSLLGIVTLTVALASSAGAVQVTAGDIVTTGNTVVAEGLGYNELGLLQHGGFVLIHDYSPVFPNDGVTDAYISPGGQIFVNEATKLTIYDSSFVPIGTPYIPGGRGEMVWDRSGHIFVANPLGNTIRKLDLNDQLLDTLTTAGPLLYFDLAADQCTVYYTDGSPQIHRHDVCTNVALPNVNSPVVDTLNQIRLAPDGSILVAGHQAVYHLAPNGSLMNQFAPIALAHYDEGAIALAPGGNQLWIAWRNGFRLVDMVTGNIVQSSDPPLDAAITSMAVMGEPRAALAPASIPTLRSAVLLLLALSVITWGLGQIR